MTKTVNKMTQCIAYMRNIRKEHPNKTPGEHNRLFKQYVMTELSMTKAGANTYCSNVNTFLAGGDPYKHNKQANAKRRLTKEAGDQLGLPYVDTNLGKLTHKADVTLDNRWWVVNEEKKQILETHSSRSIAQQVAKALGLSWKDKTKILNVA